MGSLPPLFIRRIMEEPTQEQSGAESKESGAREEKTVQIYDPAAKNRFEFTVREDGVKYEIAHIFGELTDDRYLQWLKDFNVRGTEDDVEENSREAACKLWDDLIDRVEGVEFEEGDWKSFVPYSEKVEAVNQLTAVAIGEDEDVKPATGPRRLGPATATVTVITEAWFNGDVTQQRHELRAKNAELEKKYARIQGRRFKQDQTKGFRKKQKVTYVPQDEKLGDLYDEMVIGATGFAVGFDNKSTVPLRFKTAVVHEIFASPVEAKK